MKWETFANKMETSRDILAEEAEKYICKKIETICIKNNWSFKSVYGTKIMDSDGNKLFDTEIDKMIFWFEDIFYSFGCYVFENGGWIEGQTPLIEFNKPSFLNPKKHQL